MSDTRDTHDDLSKVFEHFADRDIAIVGSAVKDYSTARDIDVLVPANVDFPAFVKALGTKYNGWDLEDGGHIRRANYKIPGVEKRVQILQNRMVESFNDWPHAVRLRDGSVLNADRHFDKRDPNAPSRQRWAKRPSRKKPFDYKY